RPIRARAAASSSPKRASSPRAPAPAARAADGTPPLRKPTTVLVLVAASLALAQPKAPEAAASTDATLTTPIELFGSKMMKFNALDINVAHDNEHYGNIVTY